MSNLLPSSDDQPAIRARIPANLSSGQISTGVIIVTGPMEFLLDFVRSLPRPNAIVSRVVLPHVVMPQFIQALETNADLYRQRFGPIPGEENSKIGLVSRDLSGNPAGHQLSPFQQSPLQHPPASVPPSENQGDASHHPEQSSRHEPASGSGSSVSDFGRPIDILPGSAAPTPGSEEEGNPYAQHHDKSSADNRQPHIPSPQDIYDELKLRDELLSGAYANAVMIGHGPYEFSFDFITNFYPQSAVSARVYMAAGHIPRLLESLKAAWDQFRPRLQGDGGLQ